MQLLQLVGRVVLLALLLPHVAHAMDGKTMKDYLDAQDASKRLFVSGYIEGVDGELGLTAPSRSFVGCEVIAIGVEQKMAVVTKYLQAHPEKWHFGAGAIIEDALNEAFPCPSYRNRNEKFERFLEDDKQRKALSQALQACETTLQTVQQKRKSAPSSAPPK